MEGPGNFREERESISASVREAGVTDVIGTVQSMCAPARFPEYRMAEDDFVKEWGVEMVAAAKRKASLARQNHGINNGAFGAVAETLPLLGNTHGFFGEDKEGKNIEAGIYTTAPSEDYDSPHADLIFEIKNVFPEEISENLAVRPVTRFMVDVTTEAEEEVSRKIERAERNFEQGRLHDIHFFKSKSNPIAKPGLPNVPNLILSVDEVEMIAFLREIKPHIDMRTGEILNKREFEEDYRNFAEILRQRLYDQAVSQARTFAEKSREQKIISEEDRWQIDGMISGGDLAGAFAFVERLEEKMEDNGKLSPGMKKKFLNYLASQKTLIETALSLKNIEDRRKKESPQQGGA